MLSIDQLKSAFKQEDTSTNRPGNYYPFWNMKVGEQAIIRFLPDGDETNPLGFMVEKLNHNLIINGENKKIPCLKMYGDDDCPICKVSAAYYKTDDKLNGKKYWRKKQHLLQALIIEDPLPADAETGENSEGEVKIIALGFQLFNIIKEAFESGELDEIPYAYENGCNFIIKKTKQGEYDTYAVGSKFARKSSSLDEDEVAALEEHLVELSTLLPAHPTYEKVEAMLEADLTGNSYDDGSSDGGEDEPDAKAPAKKTVDKKPAASTKEDDEPAPKKVTIKKKKVVEETAEESKPEDDAPAETTEATANDDGDEEFSDDAAAMLAKIRNRRKQTT